MSLLEATRMLVHLVRKRTRLLSLNGDNWEIFECPNRWCDYNIRCSTVKEDADIKVIFPKHQHACENHFQPQHTTPHQYDYGRGVSLMDPFCDDMSMEYEPRQPFKLKTPLPYTLERPSRFSNPQLAYLESWCSVQGWERTSCQLPPNSQMERLRKEIGPSPCLATWFRMRIRSCLGELIGVLAWRFDDPKTTRCKDRWSHSVYGDDWEVALCYGTLIGVQVGDGFIAKMRPVRGTKPWESLLTPSEIIWNPFQNVNQ